MWGGGGGGAATLTALVNNPKCNLLLTDAIFRKPEQKSNET